MKKKDTGEKFLIIICGDSRYHIDNPVCYAYISCDWKWRT